MTAVLLGENAFAGDIYNQTFNGGTGALVDTTPTTGVGTWTGDNIINRNGLLEGGVGCSFAGIHSNEWLAL